MIQDYLPSVLQDPRGSLSMERALKQAHELIELGIENPFYEKNEDKILATLDDLQTMLKRIRR